MPLLLSMETSTTVCSVALHHKDKLLVEQVLYFEKSHSALLPTLITEIVAHAGFNLGELSAIALSKGPGSYTGLRIGTSTAKGLCFALDIPLISVNTLTAMAWGMNFFNTEKLLLCPMLDARRMEVYCMLLNHKMNVVKETEAHILSENSFKDFLDDDKIIFFGNGSDKAKIFLGNNKHARFVQGFVPRASQIGAMALEKYLKSDFEDLAYFEPFYLKDFVGTIVKQKQL